MKMETQPRGTPLSDEERKTLSALLVKMGYIVQSKREKDGRAWKYVISATEDK